MTNMCKHAQASNAEVVLDYVDGSAVRLIVSDRGVGSEDPTGGYGLIGVRERVHLLGGEVRIETSPGEGFVLNVRVPG
jgi:signal transduction histidine kinase